MALPSAANSHVAGLILGFRPANERSLDREEPPETPLAPFTRIPITCDPQKQKLTTEE